MNPVTNEDRANYKIFTADGEVVPSLTELPSGTRLRDCFGTFYVICKEADRQSNPINKGRLGLSNCGASFEACGPQFT